MVKNLPAMQEPRVQSPGQEDLPEKGTATHSNNLAWKMPRTEEPSGLQSMGSPRVGNYTFSFVTLEHNIKCLLLKINI